MSNSFTGGRMVFNTNKGFFLTLDESAAPATLELPASKTETDTKTDTDTDTQPEQTAEITQPVSLQVAADPAPAAVTEATAATPAGSMTTAEAIAAELAAADAARPAVTYSTYAPTNLSPGSGLRQPKRKPGAALKGFRSIAQDLFKS
ncbi:MAG: hypothetical protein VXX57_01525 [Cyanobacteriota bacterium]|nr:hypothetical protein [Cyanobacteriota bacterium]